MTEHAWRWLAISVGGFAALMLTLFAVRDLVDSVGPQWASRLVHPFRKDHWGDRRP